eukprot:TRINITY_DN33509_c0_g1_i1.p1 TRINITY_DN33509_c0_g1~~TRINITY_DN33509_c0_g1_i1.p1  ORF type:complete len:193 (+),score=28.62 TRINITY_DN33509_c0_g1_i1:160-738(+)
MESLIGINGEGFSLIMADGSVTFSIIRLKQNEDKIREMNTHLLLGVVGNAGDRVHFTDLVEKEMSYYKFKNGMQLEPDGVANHIRNTLWTALRKGPYEVQTLLGGFNKEGKASLFSCDSLGTLLNVPFFAHGYSSHFLLALFDDMYKPDLTQEEGIELLRKCQEALSKRMVHQTPEYVVKLVNRDGIQKVTL